MRREVDVGGTSMLFRAERHEGKIISHLIFLLSLHNFHHCKAVPFSHSTDIISSFFSDRCFLCLLQVFFSSLNFTHLFSTEQGKCVVLHNIKARNKKNELNFSFLKFMQH